MRVEDRFAAQLRALREYALVPDGAEGLLTEDEQGGTYEQLFASNAIRSACIVWTKDIRSGPSYADSGGCTMHDWLPVKPIGSAPTCLCPEPAVGESLVRSCTRGEQRTIEYCEHVPVEGDNSALITLRVDPRSLR